MEIFILLNLHQMEFFQQIILHKIDIFDSASKNKKQQKINFNLNSC